MSIVLPGPVPEIPVANLHAAITYYVSRLGFVLDWDGGDLGLAGISCGHCRLFLADQQYRRAAGNVGPLVVWLNLQSVQEVNGLHRQWRDAGATTVSEPEPKPWGLHEFTASDPDGNLLRVFFDFQTASTPSSRS